jgi:SsrA-binding protein
MKTTVNLQNKKGSFNYQFLDKYVAGIMLIGTEVKAIRDGNVSFVDSYCVFIDNELWLTGLHISQYKFGDAHEEKRHRKLLLTKKELSKLSYNVKQSGLTIVPVRLFTTDKGLLKLEIALAKGKKSYDKREDLKLKDAKREMERVL